MTNLKSTIKDFGQHYISEIKCNELFRLDFVSDYDQENFKKSAKSQILNQFGIEIEIKMKPKFDVVFAKQENEKLRGRLGHLFNSKLTPEFVNHISKLVDKPEIDKR